MRKIACVLLAVGLVLGSIVASAESGYVSLPVQDVGRATLLDVRSNLKIKVVKFAGSTTGEMVVKLHNTGPAAETFSSRGLYFVPRVPAEHPERAPQRQGSAGPFVVVQADGSVKKVSSLEVKSGAIVQLKLQVFCLDSHRPSPRIGHRFDVATQRLPTNLSNAIESKAKGILKGNPESATYLIQRGVWGLRNKSWVKLQGERSGERRVRPGAPSAAQLFHLQAPQGQR